MRIHSPIQATQVYKIPILNRGELLLISETKQETGSFKFRAAWNLVCSVQAEHFVAASSGNFGQALARAAQLTNKKATIVMPTTSSKVKIEAVRKYGGTVVLVDTTVETRAERVERIVRDNPGLYKASAYDCDFVIEGNASLGVEIAQMSLDLDMLFVPIGGGGLSAGIITGLCREGCAIPVWGAEPVLANDASRSFQKGYLCANPQEPQSIADGARTLSLGVRNWAILQRGLQGILEVEEEEIMVAMVILADHGIRVEPTGALSVAAAIKRLQQSPTDRIGCVLSGANVDEETYQFLCAQGRDRIIPNEF